MHVALIIDGERLEHERQSLDRTAAGLESLGMRITAVLREPENGLGAELPRIGPASVVRARMHVPAWVRPARARRLADRLGAQTPDLLYAIGADGWQLGMDAARVLHRPLMLDVWSAELLRRVPRGRSAASVAGFVAPTEPIADALRRKAGADLVSLVPPGVDVPRRPRKGRAAEGGIAIAIIGSGRDVPAYRAMLGALSSLTREFPQIQACLELRGPAAHEIWRHARRLDLLSHVSSIADASHHRALLVGCDVLVVPERFGQVRSLILEAMALAMPVVAGDDPFLDMVVPDRTALVVCADDPDEWEAQIRRVLTEDPLAARLGRAARAWVAEHHRPEAHVERLAAALQGALSGGAMPLPR